MLRLQIISTGDFFVMGDSALSVDITSSLFNKQDDFLGSKSYPGKLPLEPNRRLIKNSHYINASNAGRTLQVMMWLDYLPYKEVKMTFLIDTDYIDYTLYLDSSIIARQLKNKKLHELSDPNFNGQLNFDNGAALRDYMMETITAVPGTMPMVFFPYKNDGAYKEVAEADYDDYVGIDFPVNKYINAWQVNTGTGTGQFMVDTVAAHNRETQVPFFTLPYVIKRILQYLGYTPAGSWLNEIQSNRILVSSNVPVFGTLISDYVFHMPAVNIAEFFKEIRISLGLLISFDQTNKFCLVESLVNIRSRGKVVDLRGKQLAKTYKETGSAASAFTITRGVEDKDGAYNDLEPADLPVLTIGDITESGTLDEITLNSVATRMITEISPVEAAAANWRIPYIKLPMYGSALGQIDLVEARDLNDFKLRLLYYHGMVEDAAGYLYPYGSADNLDKDGQALTDFTLGLTVTGTTYSSLKDYYTYIKNSKPFEQGFLLSRQDLLTLEASNKILVQDFDMSTVECLFDVISADLDKNQDIMAKIVLYPDIQPDNTMQVVPLIPVDPPDPPADNGVVYAKLVFRNVDNVHHLYPPPDYITHDWDLFIMFFLDAAAMIPKNVTDLSMRYKIIFYDIPGRPPTENVVPITVTSAGNEKEVYHRAPQSTTQGGTFRHWDYELMPGADYTVL